MMQIQEITRLLKDGLEALEKYVIGTCEYEQEKEICSEYMDNMIMGIESLSQNATMHLQTLSYIVSEHFDGEYVMSGYEVKDAFGKKQFFTEVESNDDGSVVIRSYSEELE